MRPICWTLGLTIAIGAMIGTLGGQATIAGIAPAATMIPVNRVQDRPAGEPYGPASYAAANPEMADYSRIASACEGCSDYERGYRFAAARRLQTAADCTDYSRDYQRGCLAYLREG